MGVPQPPPLGTAMLPAGTLHGRGRADHRRRHRARQGDGGRVRARSAPASRSPAATRSTAQRGVAAVEAVGGRALGVAMDVREPDAGRRGVRRGRARRSAARRPGQQRRRQLPGRRRGSQSPTAGAPSSEIVLNGTFHCSREFARRRIAAGPPGAILNIGATYAWTGGPGASHSAAAKAGVDNLTMTLAVEWASTASASTASPRASSRTTTWRRTCGRTGPKATPTPAARSRPGASASRTSSAGRRRTSARPTPPTSAAHTFVIDGANWQRRGLKMPEVMPIREQVPKRR